MKGITILGIESSCDDTSAAVVRDGILLSNVIASQQVHEEYGGVVPELASRAHQQNIVPVVDSALRRAGIDKKELSGIAFTRGPGLIGSLLVGTSFAKGMSLGLRIPIIDVNHLHGHVLAHFVREKTDDEVPEFPYLCLLVSGGNSQIIMVKGCNDMEILGRTIDDAAGEAFDKCAKVMGLPYPGGPHIDRLAAEGNPKAFGFAKPHIPGLDYSFSGLKTSFLYTLRDGIKADPQFIEKNRADLAASLQATIIAILTDKLEKAIRQTGDRRTWNQTGKRRCPRRRSRPVRSSRHKSLYPATQIHYRQRRNGGDSRLLQISRQDFLSIRRRTFRPRGNLMR